MIFRGISKQGNFVIFGYAHNLTNNLSETGYYVITLERNDYQAVEIKRALIGDKVLADTLKILFQEE